MHKTMTHTILTGDVMNMEPEGKFHAILCDPPYELGFMGKDWDKTGLVFKKEVWERMKDHLHDGGFLMAFASSRGWHRLAVAIEDAGFRIHPSMFLWTQGQGFPKATRIPDERFNGHRYGGQCIKPSCEPIIVAQKPYKGKPVENITRTGAGALWIDGGRIKSELPEGRTRHGGGIVGAGTSYELPDSHGEMPSGRWPSNLLLYHTPECRQEGVKKVRGNGAFPKSHGSSMFVSPEEKETRIEMTDENGNETIPNWICHPSCPVAKMDIQQDGSARFFFQVQTQLDEADPIRYQAKASRSERDAGLEGIYFMKSNTPPEIIKEIEKHLLSV